MRPIKVIAAVVCAVLVTSAWAQFMGRSMPPRPKLSDKDNVEVKLDLDEASFDDFVRALGKSTGMLILAADDLKETNKDAKLTLHETAKVSDLIVRVSLKVSAWPETAIIFCTEKQKPEREPLLDLPDKKVTAKLPEMDTSTVLAMVGAAGGVSLYATPEIIKQHPKLSVDFDGKPIEEAINEIATKLEAQVVRGIYLKKFDPQEAFKRFLSLPTAEQERIMLQAAQQFRQQGLTGDQIDKAIDNMLNRFFQMSPDERKKTARRVADGMHRLAGAVRNFSPETIRQLREAWRPLITRGLSRIRQLPPSQQAELGPILRALDELPFSR